MFSDWLRAQAARPDDVGRFAALVIADRRYPMAASRLHAVLRYCGAHQELRRLAKRAHAEWRAVRRAARR